MEYRKSNVHDIEQLVQMRWDHIQEHGNDPMHNKTEFIKTCSAFYKEALESEAWTIWIAENNHTVIAHVCVQIIKKIPKPRALHATWGYVTNVYTKPLYRNQGIGGTLIDHVKTWAKEQELEFLLLWPSEKSIDFYKRKGFVVNSTNMQCTFTSDV